MLRRINASDVIRFGAFAATNVALFYSLRWFLRYLDPARRGRATAERQAKTILDKLGIKNVRALTEYELAVASDLIDTSLIATTWTEIGGLDDVIEALKDDVILPLSHHRLFEGSTLLAPPRGVLLYGPPGCGKTMLAKALAKEIGCHFLNLQLSSLGDKWYGESQKLVSAVFSLANIIQPVVIFVDEIDAFLRYRQHSDHETTAMMKAIFMSLWDGLESDPAARIVILGATNRPEDVDPAILRRMPLRFQVGLPDSQQRLAILKVILAKEKCDDDVDLKRLSLVTDGYSGSDLREICRVAALACVRESIRDGTEATTRDQVRGIRMDDLEGACRRHRKTGDKTPFQDFGIVS